MLHLEINAGNSLTPCLDVSLFIHITGCFIVHKLDYLLNVLFSGIAALFLPHSLHADRYVCMHVTVVSTVYMN